MISQSKNADLDPHILRHNFWLMGAAFDEKLNRISRRNDDAMYGGLDLRAYKVLWFEKRWILWLKVN